MLPAAMWHLHSSLLSPTWCGEGGQPCSMCAPWSRARAAENYSAKWPKYFVVFYPNGSTVKGINLDMPWGTGEASFIFAIVLQCNLHLVREQDGLVIQILILSQLRYLSHQFKVRTKVRDR